MKTACNYPENNVDEVIPRLWLGDYKSSYNKDFLLDNDITYIIRVMPEFDGRFEHITYLHIPIHDKDMCQKKLTYLFNKTNNLIKHALKNKKGILVHCKKGHHRSAVVVAAFLIKHLLTDYIATVAYINHLRPCALRRNTCMVRGLYRYYLELNKIKCNKIECSKENRFYHCRCSLPLL